MLYLSVYAGAGMWILLLLHRRLHRRRLRFAPFRPIVLDEARREVLPPWWLTMMKALLVALCLPVLVALWPVTAAVMLRAIRAARPPESSRRHSVVDHSAVDHGAVDHSAVDRRALAFTVGLRDLRLPMNIASIEANERVLDPQGLLPELPFGHLNQAWREFVATRQDDEMIWSFSACRPSPSGVGEARYTGYVRVLGESIGPHFLTRIRPVAGESAGPTGLELAISRLAAASPQTPDPRSQSR